MGGDDYTHDARQAVHDKSGEGPAAATCPDAVSTPFAHIFNEYNSSERTQVWAFERSRQSFLRLS